MHFNPKHLDGFRDILEVLNTKAGKIRGNFAFDVTPARLVTGLVTERGTCEASEEGLSGLYPEQAAATI